jgi:hypothetical protein
MKPFFELRAIKNFVMLLHEEITRHLLCSDSGIKPLDDSTIKAFSEKVEKYIVSLIDSASIRRSQSQDSDGAGLEESLMKDLESSDPFTSTGARITAASVLARLGPQ